MATDMSCAICESMMMRPIRYLMDDDDQAENARHPDQDAASIAKRLQKAITLWGECLRTTGGALSPSKSFWRLVDYLWDNRGNYSHADLDHLPDARLTVPENGQQKVVERIAPTVGKRTLGVRLAPTGVDMDELNYLKQASEEWAAKFRKSCTLLCWCD